MLADEAALPTKTEFHEARIADDNPLQPQQFIEIDGPATSLPYRASPALDAILWRTFSFDGIAGFRILKQQKGGGARQQSARDIGDDGLSAMGQVHRAEFL